MLKNLNKSIKAFLFFASLVSIALSEACPVGKNGARVPILPTRLSPLPPPTRPRQTGQGQNSHRPPCEKESCPFPLRGAKCSGAELAVSRQQGEEARAPGVQGTKLPLPWSSQRIFLFLAFHSVPLPASWLRPPSAALVARHAGSFWVPHVSSVQLSAPRCKT